MKRRLTTDSGGHNPVCGQVPWGPEGRLALERNGSSSAGGASSEFYLLFLTGGTLQRD
jgi:hypothetical protein